MEQKYYTSLGYYMKETQIYIQFTLLFLWKQENIYPNQF